MKISHAYRSVISKNSVTSNILKNISKQKNALNIEISMTVELFQFWLKNCMALFFFKQAQLLKHGVAAVINL